MFSGLSILGTILIFIGLADLIRNRAGGCLEYFMLGGFMLFRFFSNEDLYLQFEECGFKWSSSPFVFLIVTAGQIVLGINLIFWSDILEAQFGFFDLGKFLKMFYW